MEFLLCLLAVITVTSAQGIYIDSSYPYLPGPLPTAVKAFNNSAVGGPPVPIRVYYPDTAATHTDYALNLFIGGFHGLVPGALYADVLAPLASHGYIVASPWTAGSDVDEFAAIVNWLHANLDAEIGLTASWDHLTMGCNSAGCDNILDLIMAYPLQNKILAVANLEPFSGTVSVMPLPYTMPGYFMGGELSNGTCIFPFGDYQAFYDSWECPRILMDVAGYGHCDILTYPGAWQACQTVMGCPTGPESGLTDYKNFVQGVMAALFNTYSQGSPQYLDYLTDTDNLPLAIDQYAQDLNC